MNYIKKTIYLIYKLFILFLIIFFLLLLTCLPSNYMFKNSLIISETFDNTDLEDAFCNKYNSTPDKLKKHCENLGKNRCDGVKCCVLLNNQKCVPGDKKGPTYLSENGIPHNIKTIHHLGKQL